MKTTKKYVIGSVWKGKYGSFTIKDYINKKTIQVEFCATKTLKYTDAKSITFGTVKDPFYPSVLGVGCVGNTSTNIVGSKIKASYTAWRGILRRCYDIQSWDKNPTYKGCTVCDEWLCFETFERWYDAHKVDGWEIDKDLTVVGNKVYSPDTCVFCPPYINNLISKKEKELPTGVSYHKRDNIYNAKLWDGSKLLHLGDFTTPEEASCAYIKAKSDYVKSVAEKAFNKKHINETVYKNLINWEFS